MHSTQLSGVLAAHQQTTLLEGPLGAVEMLPQSATGGRLAVVRHPLAPRALGSPMHTHHDEDEYSIVLEGTVGVQLGDATLEARPGDTILKPRSIPHAFWNPTDEPAVLLEIIIPGRFADYFAELADVVAAGRPVEQLMSLAERYNLVIDLSSVQVLAQAHGLRLDR